MGSSNVACSISSISIGYGDNIAYIPLEVSKYPNKIGDGNNILIYPRCFYSPVTLPIFGNYNDYGGIENIERDANVKIIEAHFGEKIEDVCGLYAHDVKPVSSGMFIHREIFDTLVKKCSQVNECGKENLEFRGKNQLSNYFDKFVESIKKAKDYHKEYLKMVGLNTRTKYTLWLDDAYNTFNFRDYEEFRKIYFPQIENGEFKKELIQFITFESGMIAVNRFYFPAMNGYQCGNHYASKLLYEKAASIMRKEIKESEEDREIEIDNI